MSDEDPFAEPDDADKTVIKPNPGGRRTQYSTPQAQNQLQGETSLTPSDHRQALGIPNPAPAVEHDSNSSDLSVEQCMTGMNKLNASATTLFNLISRIRNRAQHMDPEVLRRSVVAEVRAFENRALQAGVEAQEIKIARYAICATLDDVVLNTPWGGHSIWAQQSMVGTFHKETVGGDRFYDLLARLEKEPGANTDLLEFLYMCLSVGFEGRLRVEERGSEKHLQIRAGLARIIRGQRGVVERELSPHWKGVELPHKVLSIWKPVWITSATVALALTLIFMSFSWMLNRSTDRVLGQVSVLDTGQVVELFRRAPPPPPPPPPPTKQIERVKGFLEQEIELGIVEVFQDQSTITVRLAGSGMFGSGSDRLEAAFDEPLYKVSTALNDTSGPIVIVGHSDNIPIRSSRFPSNMHLSLARAETVMRTLAGELDDETRLRAEGRAEKEPIADNSTRDGRAKNRRIEVVLVRKDAT